MKPRKLHVQTVHLSGAAMRPHNWTREMPNDPRYGTDKPFDDDVTNYAQIKIFRPGDHPYCVVFIDER